MSKKEFLADGGKELPDPPQPKERKGRSILQRLGDWVHQTVRHTEEAWAETNYRNLMELLGQADSRRIEGSSSWIDRRFAHWCGPVVVAKDESFIFLTHVGEKNGKLHAPQIGFLVSEGKAKPVFCADDRQRFSFATVEGHFSGAEICPQLNGKLNRFVQHCWREMKAAGVFERAKTQMPEPEPSLNGEQIPELKQQRENRSSHVEGPESKRTPESDSTPANEERTEPMAKRKKSQAAVAPELPTAPNEERRETAEAPADSKPERRPPFVEIKLGRVRANVWESSNGDSTRWTVTLSRSYRDREGKWHRTSSWDLQDLPNVARLVQEAEATIQKQLAKTPGKDKEPGLER